jgi:hypothetical protein
MYFKGVGQWTAEIEQATDFKELVLAFDFVFFTKTPNLDVWLDFGDPKYNIRLFGSAADEAPPKPS